LTVWNDKTLDGPIGSIPNRVLVFKITIQEKCEPKTTVFAT